MEITTKIENDRVENVFVSGIQIGRILTVQKPDKVEYHFNATSLSFEPWRADTREGLIAEIQEQANAL